MGDSGSDDRPWVEGITIGQVLCESAKAHPDQDALVFAQFQERMSWRQFELCTDRVARALLSLGLGKGDHLAVWGTNRPQWVLLQFASARIGVVLVTVNPAYRTHELRYALKQSDAKVLAMGEGFRSNSYDEMLAEICPEIAQPGHMHEDGLRSRTFPRLKHVIGFTNHAIQGVMPWDEFYGRADAVSPHELVEREAGVLPGEVINIQYTSGTTGFPKGAMLTHRNLLLNAYYIGRCQRIGAADRMCIPVPLYHCFGCVLGTMCAVVHGAAMVFPHETFDAGKTLDAVEAQRCTVLYGVPTMFISQLENATFAGRDLSSLRTGIMAGSPCPLAVMKRVMQQMHCGEMTIAYGQTEASPVITQTRFDDPIELRVGSVGRPLPGVEVKITAPSPRKEEAAQGKALPAGEQGELCARGHVVMRGYYNMPEQTAEAIDEEGWLHTGDLAVALDNGYYRITGRLKDMIIRGGENIYPREIEEFLYQHPAIADVQVVGVPDEKYGEQVLAWIKLREGHSLTQEQVREHCRKHMAYFKAPRYVKFVDAFPMTVTGKVQKFKIREQAIEELGLQTAANVETA